MRKLVLQMQMSVDGFVGAVSPHDWQLGVGATTSLGRQAQAGLRTFFCDRRYLLLSRKMAEDGI